MKLALMLGAMAAGRRAGGPRELLSQGTKLLETSPELSRLVGEVRGRLLEAGKGAAVAVATRQVESLTDRVGKRVESLAGAGAPPRGKADEEPEPEPERDRYSEDEYAQDEYEQDSGSGAEPEEEPAEEPAAAPPPRRTRAPAAKTTAARAGKNPSASAAVRRSASSAGKAGGRKPARAGRTQRSNGDG